MTEKHNSPHIEDNNYNRFNSSNNRSLSSNQVDLSIETMNKSISVPFSDTIIERVGISPKEVSNSSLKTIPHFSTNPDDTIQPKEKTSIFSKRLAERKL